MANIILASHGCLLYTSETARIPVGAGRLEFFVPAGSGDAAVPWPVWNKRHRMWKTARSPDHEGGSICLLYTSRCV